MDDVIYTHKEVTKLLDAIRETVITFPGFSVTPRANASGKYIGINVVSNTGKSKGVIIVLEDN